MPAPMTRDELSSHRCDRDERWLLRDGRGIELSYVCDDCHDARVATYNPAILDYYTQADVDEQIEPEEYYGCENDW